MAWSYIEELILKKTIRSSKMILYKKAEFWNRIFYQLRFQTSKEEIGSTTTQSEVSWLN